MTGQPTNDAICTASVICSNGIICICILDKAATADTGPVLGLGFFPLFLCALFAANTISPARSTTSVADNSKEFSAAMRFHSGKSCAARLDMGWIPRLGVCPETSKCLILLTKQGFPTVGYGNARATLEGRNRNANNRCRGSGLLRQSRNVPGGAGREGNNR